MNDQVDLSDDEQFTVYHPKEIAQILNELAKTKAIINVSFNRGNDQCLTTVIGINYDKKAVYLDIGMDTNFNRKLLESNHMIFSKDDGIRVRWTSQKIDLVKLKDGEALKIVLPESLMRLQRREFFRCPTPVVNPLICQCSVYHPLRPQAAEMLELTLLDISLGGIGTYVETLPPTIEVGTILTDCRLKFPEFGDVTLGLTVKNIKEITLKNGATRTRVGLKFQNLSRVEEKIIQRYVFNLERELLLLAKSD
jgi:flagellar brake protein